MVIAVAESLVRYAEKNGITSDNIIATMDDITYSGMLLDSMEKGGDIEKVPLEMINTAF